MKDAAEQTVSDLENEMKKVKQDLNKAIDTIRSVPGQIDDNIVTPIVNKVRR